MLAEMLEMLAQMLAIEMLLIEIEYSEQQMSPESYRRILVTEGVRRQRLELAI